MVNDTVLTLLLARLSYLEGELEKAREQAAIDALTGLFNRRMFDSHLKKAVSKAVRVHQPLSLLIIDIDHFKAINDSRGHQAGDHILKRVSHKLAERLRSFDHVFRYGGEEFAVLLSNTPVVVATQVADRLRKGVKSCGVTISVGISSTEMAVNPIDLVARADRALYNAKSQGRDRVVIDH